MTGELRVRGDVEEDEEDKFVWESKNWERTNQHRTQGTDV